jgi:hypothetical protein
LGCFVDVGGVADGFVEGVLDGVFAAWGEGVAGFRPDGGPFSTGVGLGVPPGEATRSSGSRSPAAAAAAPEVAPASRVAATTIATVRLFGIGQSPPYW